MEASTATDLLNPAYSPMIRIVWVTCCIYFYFILFYYFLLAVPCSMQELSSPTRNWTHAPCIGSLNHWTTRVSQILILQMENPRVRKVKWLVQSHWWVKREMSGFESRAPFTISYVLHLSCHERLCQCVLCRHAMSVTVPAFKTGQTSLETSTMMSGKRLMLLWEHKWCIAKSASMLGDDNSRLVSFLKERGRVEMGRPGRKS